ncbi:hypothetical protein [Gluconacetobacter diazotrophicus]|uniref:hypothetical protein n=1 Tax=Gluconacetobacter diazotrophicus TaxID=33996 RepID=UPI00218099F8|nr:hypothetical protein [Gluconacetobacter diazotrophicus]
MMLAINYFGPNMVAAEIPIVFHDPCRDDASRRVFLARPAIDRHKLDINIQRSSDVGNRV